jgi:hypothetical protein
MIEKIPPFRPGELATNSLDGYALATAMGSNTRAYHSLLWPALQPPGCRRLLLSSLQENKNKKTSLIKPRTGFEPATSSLPRTRYTGLSYRGANSPLC